MLVARQNTGEIDRDFIGGSNLAAPEDVFRGYGLAFIIPTLLSRTLTYGNLFITPSRNWAVQIFYFQTSSYSFDTLGK